MSADQAGERRPGHQPEWTVDRTLERTRTLDSIEQGFHCNLKPRAAVDAVGR